MLRFLPLIAKSVLRYRTRSLLAAGGVALAMSLFGAVEAMQAGVERATVRTAQDNVLVVYRENRFCPFASRLPQFYRDRIARVDGVAGVVPMRIIVSNCRASLDVVTFRGVPADDFARSLLPRMEFVAGSLDAWHSRSDAAVLGEALAQRRRARVGDRFTSAGISVYVAGIVRSADPQDRNVAYTHLGFLQESAQRGGTGGIVTQFNVLVRDPDRLQEVARAIDAEFESERDPTQTWPEKTFVARAAADLVAMVAFATWLAIGALIAVAALVGNAIVLALQDRVREHAILQTLGYRGSLVVRLVVGEGALLGLLGGAVGSGAAALLIGRGRYAFANEGLNVELETSVGTVLLGLAVAAAIGAAASVVPALLAARRDVVDSLRAA
jgi:putative ABC transport system permease protein